MVIGRRSCNREVAGSTSGCFIVNEYNLVLANGQRCSVAKTKVTVDHRRLLMNVYPCILVRERSALETIIVSE